MGRNVTLDFSAGGGSDTEFLIGSITLEPTLVHEVGNRVVLPMPRTTGISAGIGTLEDVAVSPVGPEPAWAYRATVRDSISGKAQSWLVGVPTGTSSIPFKQLTKFTTTIPPQTTAGMMQNWADTTEANADRSELAADRAEAPTDLMNKTLIENPASLTNNALTAAIVELATTGGELRSKAKADNLDHTEQIQAELDALTSAGGGTLVIPSSSFGAVSIKVKNLTLKNDGAIPAKQPVIVIRGQGAHWSGRGTVPVGGSILEFTEADTYGLLKTNGLGLLRLQDITLRNTDPLISTPFVYTTNTTIQIQHTSFYGAKAGANCDQDAIVLGGTQQIESFNGWDHGFQGYGSVVSENFFSGIRRPVVGQAFANAVVIRDNTIWTTCGNPTGAAIEWNGKPTTGGQFAAGNVIEGNLIELPNYKYGISLKWAAFFTVSANNMYDATGTTVAGIYVDATSENNTIREGMTSPGLAPIVDNGKNTWFTPSGQGIYANQPPSKFLDIDYPTILRRAVITARDSQFFAQPDGAQSDSSSLFSLRRSDAEASQPGVRVFDYFQNGRRRLQGSQAGNEENYNADGVLFSGFSGGGRTWFAGGTGGAMTWDTGTGGSAATIKAAYLQLTDHTGAKYIRLASAQPSDASLANGEVGIYWNKATGALEFRGKNSAGTVIQKTIATL